MDLNIVKAKVERIVSELFEETELFESSGRDSDGDYFLERYFNGTTKFYVSVFPIKTFGLPETTWDDLELPEFQVRIWGNVASNLKPGAALYKFVIEESDWLAFTKLKVYHRDDKRVDLFMEVILAADTIDTPELRNALVFLVRDCESIRSSIPEKLRSE